MVEATNDGLLDLVTVVIPTRDEVRGVLGLFLMSSLGSVFPGMVSSLLMVVVGMVLWMWPWGGMVLGLFSRRVG
ncbi:hypothetical protein [Vulcanisaeta souniana]|uniref:hypothetical protein n=1 Tax=Vulcanisaeta souniana TaxID=164452 RepID=UPI000AD433F0|nr:hypothetical protein [Vulcanisaeta souniana]